MLEAEGIVQIKKDRDILENRPETHRGRVSKGNVFFGGLLSQSALLFCP